MKNTLILLLSLCPFWIMCQVDKSVDESWEFVNEQSGLKVFTRMPENSSIKELRILVELKGSMDTLISIVNDAKNFGQWVYKCNGSEAVEAPEDYMVAYSAITDFPFPLSDRELVAKSKQWYDEDGKYHTHGFCAPDAIPAKKNTVRIKHYESRWVIEQKEEGKIYVDYTSSIDPGGNIPAWVVNLAITSGPIKTFTKLIDLVEKRSNVSGISYMR